MEKNINFILCHGTKHKKYNFIKNYHKNIFVDENINSEPHICMNILDHNKFDNLKNYKNKVNEISSIYAPLDLFFNKLVLYPNFVNLNVEKIRKIFTGVKFNKNFMKFILYLLKPGGKMIFTDNFFFHSNNLCNSLAKKLAKYFLGKQFANYFYVSLCYKSESIDLHKRNFKKVIALVKK
jgi:hypothetical protein